MISELQEFINELDPSQIPEERRQILFELSHYIQKKKNMKEQVYLNFICTHNSRRSQLCQVWARTAAVHYGLEDLETGSGGTETTAFHPNAVGALRSSGFQIHKIPRGTNPLFEVFFDPQKEPVTCYSKLYSEVWPKGISFAAILTCSEAEAACPYIPEAEKRFSLKYEDPKNADGTPEEQQQYSERNLQIATEMFYLFSLI